MESFMEIKRKNPKMEALETELIEYMESNFSTIPNERPLIRTRYLIGEIMGDDKIVVYAEIIYIIERMFFSLNLTNTSGFRIPIGSLKEDRIKNIQISTEKTKQIINFLENRNKTMRLLQSLKTVFGKNNELTVTFAMKNVNIYFSVHSENNSDLKDLNIASIQLSGPYTKNNGTFDVCFRKKSGIPTRISEKYELLSDPIKLKEIIISVLKINIK